MIVYSDDDDDSGYKTDNINKLLSIEENFEGERPSLLQPPAPPPPPPPPKKRKLSKRALPSATQTHLTPENEAFLTQLGFKLQHAESKK